MVRVVRQLSGEPGPRDRLAEHVAKSTAGLGLVPGRARALTERFGHGGMREAAALVRRAGDCPADRLSV
ncbi:hypothetical protein [Streptomyces niveus]|uniref:hypothetical protein n=1 Tax=Streptomyces niveus TaxID=193462 RepID=UPI0038666DD7